MSDFASTRTKCIGLIRGGDYHSISTQITALFETDIECQTINYIRGLCEETDFPTNGMIHRLIDDGFVARQLLLVRRLIEPDALDPKQEHRRVVSLPRIIHEMKKVQPLITRRDFVCVDGTAYEGDINQADFPGYFKTMSRHEAFDKMSRKKPELRDSEDRICEEYFEQLLNDLESNKSAKAVKTYCDKFLAHASDIENRFVDKQGHALVTNVTLNDLQEIYVWLAKTTNELSVVLLGDSCYHFVPTGGDRLHALDQPICPPSRLDDARNFWRSREKELGSLIR